MHRSLRLVTTLLVASLTVALAHPASAAPGASGVAARRADSGVHISRSSFEGADALRAGRKEQVRVRRDRVWLAGSHATRRYQGSQYDVGRWTSPWVGTPYGLRQLVASWEARTPGNSWIEVQVKGRTADGRASSWDVLGRWARDDRFVHRTSWSPQSDDLASVSVDTWKASTPLTSYRLRVSLMRKVGARSKPPSLGFVGAMASRLPSGDRPTSKPGVVAKAGGTVLDVPRYSQMVHDGDYSRWGGGGEAWCSPTSTSMVLGYYGDLPPASAYSWVKKPHPARFVDYAARMTYDHDYDGTGNWPFNTAYAAGLTGHAFVTRLPDLRLAERLIKVGIPVVVSIAFGKGDLPNAPISASNGHLVVIVGFTKAGDVVVNDPAADSASGVRRTYDRARFEDAWLPTSGGLAYVIHDDAHPLPAALP
ncbi:C39 family peptidase [Nocardioides acrostichi]|uniref:C39 family peptidase n=1 Tax=Nocardioides acrostichi TaxID=2784339 RepID=A0A930UZY3_9ACTN|nr:C39 family peptidase [Nocardioides acrostichi]MBF4161489.1 C39 family peptidase [Nocardioides acrostichi]